MLHRRVPFLRLFLPLCIGIIAGRFFHLPLIVPLTFLAVLFTLLVLFYSAKEKSGNISFGITLNLFILAGGFLLCTYERSSLTNLGREKSLFVAQVSDFPVEKENSYLLRIKLITILKDKAPQKANGSMLIYHQKSRAVLNLMPGDLLIFRCTPQEISNRGNPGEFNYRFYMESKGIKYYAFTRDTDFIKVARPGSVSLRHMSVIFREKVISLYRRRGMEDKEVALAAAITLGEKDMLDASQKDNFSKAGVMHLMAVSGLHAGILSYFMFTALFFLRRKLNWLRILITVTTLWVFAFTAGLTPSVLRASLMFTFLHAGQLMKRRPDPVNTMLASAFVIALAKPTVIFDPAFLLSYMAVLSILLFYNDLYQTIHFRWRTTDRIWQMIVVSVTAQAGTLPLTIMMFNRFPLLFLLSNLIIIPLGGVIVIAGFMTIISSPLPTVSQVFATLAGKSAWLAGFLTEKTAALPFSSIDNIGMSLTECLFLSLFLTFLLYYISGKYKTTIILPLSALLLYSLSLTIRHISVISGSEVIVYNTPGQTALGIREGKNLKLFCRGNEIPAEVKKHCAAAGLRLRLTEIEKEVPLLIKSGYLRIIVTERFNDAVLTRNPDILILTETGHARMQNKEIYPYVVFAVVDSPSKEGEYSENGLWYVRDKGCWRMKL